jgi:hypothetical protein
MMRVATGETNPRQNDEGCKQLLLSFFKLGSRAPLKLPCMAKNLRMI